MTDLAIHTDTPEDWDTVTELLGIEWANPKTRWAHHGRNSVILTPSHKFCSLAWAQGMGYQVVKASDWIAKKNAMNKPKEDIVLSWFCERSGLTRGAAKVALALIVIGFCLSVVACYFL